MAQRAQHSDVTLCNNDVITEGTRHSDITGKGAWRGYVTPMTSQPKGRVTVTSHGQDR